MSTKPGQLQERPLITRAFPARDGSMNFEAGQESASRVDYSRAKHPVRREGEYRRSTTIASTRMTVVGAVVVCAAAAAPLVVS